MHEIFPPAAQVFFSALPRHFLLLITAPSRSSRSPRAREVDASIAARHPPPCPTEMPGPDPFCWSARDNVPAPPRIDPVPHPAIFFGSNFRRDPLGNRI